MHQYKKNKASLNSRNSFLKVFSNKKIAQNLNSSRQKMYNSVVEKPLRSQTLKFQRCQVIIYSIILQWFIEFTKYLLGIFQENLESAENIL